MEIPKETKENKGSGGGNSAQLLYQEVLAELKWLVFNWKTVSFQLKWIVSSLSQALCSSFQL